MPSFGFSTAGRILFGRGQAEEAAGIAAGHGRRVLLVRGRSVPWVDRLEDQLDAAGCSVIRVAARGEPTVEQVEAAVDRARAEGCDVVVAVGGGTVIDLGKAVAAIAPGRGALMDHLETVGGGRPLEAAPLPFVALPTTAGTGSEVTRNAVIGVPEARRKVSLRDDRMLADVAIVDPALTDHAPASVTFASGLDAVVQVIEPYLSRRANPLTDALCRDAIPRGLRALARLAQAEDATARDEMAYVSLCGGLALANAGLGAVHGLAGVIGGRHDAPHGVICGRLLGPVLSANRGAVANTGGDLARFDAVERWIATELALPSQSGAADLADWLDARGLPRLAQWVPQEADLDAVATDAASASSMAANPVALSPPALIRAIRAAL
ncbi:iron-containing alcohol dehydrogenase [Sulfitobacter sp. D35]|uniref:iron-containing alcohol dehydrogenase n=1 Tax=Sulfitobacter sp. D35 TaxID=3083252 RepID=UPI00296FD5E5|nr:iron-containing alcohol dehydrogenase [Sulfitobacter sp. D35]MDW4500368.1 iron-containing alcohol dehydrogenase [Sulfitobacter sp. D35]